LVGSQIISSIVGSNNGASVGGFVRARIVGATEEESVGVGFLVGRRVGFEVGRRVGFLASFGAFVLFGVRVGPSLGPSLG